MCVRPLAFSLVGADTLGRRGGSRSLLVQSYTGDCNIRRSRRNDARVKVGHHDQARSRRVCRA